MSDPVFLTIEQINSLHRIALNRYGGQDGVRDPAALESAATQPCNVWLILAVWGQVSGLPVRGGSASALEFGHFRARFGLPLSGTSSETLSSRVSPAGQGMFTHHRLKIAELQSAVAPPFGTSAQTRIHHRFVLAVGLSFACSAGLRRSGGAPCL